MKPKLFILSVAAVAAAGFFGLACRAAASGPTIWTTDIYTAVTWTAESSPYLVPDDFWVGIGGTLTIEPGVVVKFGPSTTSQMLTNDGNIIARGSATSTIIFTSIKDDTTSDGDTNGDGGATLPAVGDWYRIQSSNSADVFEYVEIRYSNLGIDVYSASPNIRHSSFHNNNYGLRVTNAPAAAIIENNEFYENAYGIYFSSVPLGGTSFGTNNNFYDNSVYGIFNLWYTAPIIANGNWWGSAAGPCRPVSDPNVFGDCAGFGDMASSGFIISDFLAETYSDAPSPPSEPAASSQAGGISSSPSPPQILNFEASSSEVIEGLESKVVLSWNTAGANQAEFSEEGYSSELTTLLGFREVAPKQTTTYVLTAYGPGGAASKSVTVAVRRRDPVVIVPGILGSMRDRIDLIIDYYAGNDGKPSLDPIMHTYDGLWEGLKSVGYEPGKTLFDFPYNWRKDNRETAKLLGQRIDEILQICKCEKVDVVAHSMGGLVTRYYIQNINGNTIDQLIFLGTPQQGAPKAYLAWEVGEMGNKASDLIVENIIFIESAVHGYNHVVPYIHDKIPSLAELLPVFKYLTSYDTGEFYEYQKCIEGFFECNQFLDQLNNVKPEDYQGIRVYNIVNDAIPTFRAFVIKKSDDPRDKGLWAHGKPVDYPKNTGMITAGGDETVPFNSAGWGIENFIKFDVTHKDLPYFSQSGVAKILIGKEISPLRGAKLINKILFIGIHSPVDITVTAPSGKVYGAGVGDDGWVFYSGAADPEFMTIPEPEDGNYSITIVGTGEGGKFGLETALFADDIENKTLYEGVIAPGETQKFTLTASPEEPAILTLVDIKAPETALMMSGEKISDAEYAPGASAALSVRDDSLEGLETLFSMDAGVTWQKYEQTLSFEKLGSYEILYKSSDASGNVESIRISHFAIVPRPVAVATPTEPEPVSEPEILSIPAAASSTASTTAEVLGTTTTSQPNITDKQNWIEILPRVLVALIVLFGFGFFIKLIINKKKEKV